MDKNQKERKKERKKEKKITMLPTFTDYTDGRIVCFVHKLTDYC